MLSIRFAEEPRGHTAIAGDAKAAGPEPPRTIVTGRVLLAHLRITI